MASLRLGLCVHLVWLVACGGGGGARPALTANGAADVASGEPAKRVVYCASTVTEDDVHRCIYELTAEEQRRREASYRIEYEGDRMVSFVKVNGVGTPLADPDGCVTSSYHYSGDRLAERRCTNHAGTVIEGTIFSEGGALYRRVDGARRPLNFRKSRAVTIRRELDERGQVVSVRYLDRDGRTVPSESGDGFARMERDARGAQLEARHYDDLGRPMLQEDGYHRLVRVPDERDFTLELRQFGLEGEPVLNASDKWHLRRSEPDADGQLVSNRYFGLEDEPVNDASLGAHEWRVLVRGVGGVVRAAGLFDAAGRAVVGSEGWHRFERELDGRGFPLSVRYFDTEGARVAVEGRHWAKSWTYTAEGLMTREAYLDAAARPVLGDEDWATRTLSYDERGYVATVEYLGPDGELADGGRGYARLALTRDGFGQVVEERYFDASGAPATATKGKWAIIRSEYGDDGRVVARHRVSADGVTLPYRTFTIIEGVDQRTAELAHIELLKGRAGEFVVRDVQDAHPTRAGRFTDAVDALPAALAELMRPRRDGEVVMIRMGEKFGVFRVEEHF